MLLGVRGIVKVYEEVPGNTKVCKGVLRSPGQYSGDQGVLWSAKEC